MLWRLRFRGTLLWQLRRNALLRRLRFGNNGSTTFFVCLLLCLLLKEFFFCLPSFSAAQCVFLGPPVGIQTQGGVL